MDKTTTAIVDAAYLPLSIIIIGIGNADFGKMEILDGDQGLYDSSGRKAKRDLVQFVPFNKFKGNPLKLAENVLEELPTQLCEYMRLMNIKPNPPLVVDLNNMQFSSMNLPGPAPAPPGNPQKQGGGLQNFGQKMANAGRKIYTTPICFFCSNTLYKYYSIPHIPTSLPPPTSQF